MKELCPCPDMSNKQKEGHLFTEKPQVMGEPVYFLYVSGQEPVKKIISPGVPPSSWLGIVGL